jgi:hypothetical protein
VLPVAGSSGDAAQPALAASNASRFATLRMP